MNSASRAVGDSSRAIGVFTVLFAGTRVAHSVLTVGTSVESRGGVETTFPPHPGREAVPMTTPGGWNRLLAEDDWCRGPGQMPTPAYSEYLPPPRVGVKPYGDLDRLVRRPADNFGWHVSEYEQAFELEPGLGLIARETLEEVTKLGR